MSSFESDGVDRAADGVPPDGAPAVPGDQPLTAAPVGVVPRTRVGAAWVGVCVLAVVSIALIVFMAQNTGRVQVTFLWMHGSLPLALALLMAAVGGILVVLVLGTARITQLRRLTRRRERAAHSRIPAP